MTATSAINAYTKVGTESAVIGADPHALISILFQGALLAIADAKNDILRNELTAKGKSISKAISIIGQGLNASLDKSAGGELARNLSSLYDYMVRRLVAGNSSNDVAALDEVTRLLTQLTEAWDAIRPQVMNTEAQSDAPPNAKRVYATA